MKIDKKNEPKGGEYGKSLLEDTIPCTIYHSRPEKDPFHPNTPTLRRVLLFSVIPRINAPSIGYRDIALRQEALVNSAHSLGRALETE